MRSAGLKNITAKHLALASQSLSVVVALMDSFKELGKRFMGKDGVFWRGVWKVETGMFHLLNVGRVEHLTDLRGI